MAAEQIITQLRAEVEGRPARVSVLWRELSGEPIFAYGAEQEMVSASVIKVPILTAALARIGRGEATIRQALRITAEDILGDSIAFETGPREATLEELLTWMIVESDNTATNVLIRWMGMQEINRHIQELGLEQTCLRREMLDFEAIAQGRNNHTSAADMYRLFQALYTDAILTPALCGAARHILGKQRSFDALPRHIWEDATAAHKTGGLDHLSHDVGVFIYQGRQWFLGVLAQGTPEIEGDKALIGRISRLVFQHYAQETGARYALVHSGIAPLYTEPTTHSELADEALHGMVVEILDRPLPGWRRVRTHYRYEGYTPAENLLPGEALVHQWMKQKKQVVRAPFLDIMADKRVQAAHIAGVPRGSVVCPVGMPDAGGWQELRLPDGSAGFTRATHLGAFIDHWDAKREVRLRKSIVESALSYLGAQYRWGGKTPLGIDCSGLTAMAYLLNGILIYRDAAIKEGFPVKEIPLEQIQPADLLFFPGHVAMYIGEGEYVHATGRAGDDGVVLNSLREDNPRYRADLKDGIKAVGSVFVRGTRSTYGQMMQTQQGTTDIL